MTPAIQVTMDAADPPALGAFWAEVLGYEEQAPPDGYDSWDAFLDDIRVAEDERVVGLGATRVETFDREHEYWVVLRDPEGNEFCIQ